MRRIISFDAAARISEILFGLFILFHLAVIIGILFLDFVPVDYLWGGRMETAEQLLGFEILSLLVISLCLLFVLIRTGRLNIPVLYGTSRIVLWILFGLFLLNTIGNLLAESSFEKLFAIITAILSFLCLRLAIGRENK
jgi:hypothetical protein